MLGFKKGISLKDWLEKDYRAISSARESGCECKSRNPKQVLHIGSINRPHPARLIPSSGEERSWRHARICAKLLAAQIKTLSVFAHAALPVTNS